MTNVRNRWRRSGPIRRAGFGLAAAHRRVRWVLLPFVLTTVALAAPASPRLTAPAPARNYTLSLFSEQGYHSMHVRGASADLRNPARIGLSELTLTLFSGDASRRVDTIILSPEAVLVPESQQVSGPSAVRVIRDDLELTGQDWHYDHAGKKILIRRNARIVFRAELSDILK
jgi:hypothetical protein